MIYRGSDDLFYLYPLNMQALELDHSHVKALYTRAQGYIQIAKYDRAEMDIINAAKLQSEQQGCL